MAAGPSGSQEDIPPDVLMRWRAAEEQLYPVVMVRPDLYERSIEFGRAAEIAARVVRRESLTTEGVDLALATTAAFSLRYRELVGEVARERAIERIRAARERGDAWVVLHESGTLEQAPAVPYRRLEMHLGDGAGLHLFVQQDPETAAPVYGVESVQLDPQTGDWLHDASGWAEPRMLSTPESWRDLIQELRERLASP